MATLSYMARKGSNLIFIQVLKVQCVLDCFFSVFSSHRSELQDKGCHMV